MNRKVWKHSRLFASVDWQAVNRIDWYFPQALSKSWQMLVFLIINYNLYTTDSTSMACMVYLHWRQQKNPLVALRRIPQEWLQTREFSPKYFHISNSRNGKQSETLMIIFFSGMCKITKEVESIFRTNTFSFGSLFLRWRHRLIARTRTRLREDEPLSQRCRLKRVTGCKSLS